MTVGSKVKQTLVSLKGVQATLGIYSAQTQDGNSVAVYKESLKIIDEVITDLDKRIQTLEFEEPQYKGF